MKDFSRVVVVNNIKLPIDASVKEAFSVARRKLLRCGINSRDFFVFRRSVDARNKDNIKFVYSIAAQTDSPDVNSPDVSFITQESVEIAHGNTPLSDRPIVVGAGPCGMFAALLLAENGYEPIVIERGGSIGERTSAVKRFNDKRILDTDSNIQFGAGGAGTFSDGKLVTRINDPLTGYILDRFVEFGAPNDIKFIAKPHIGTDVLSIVVDRMLAKIEALGGTVMYHTKLISLNTRGSRVTSVLTNKGEIPCGAVVLAIGHSARDTYDYMLSAGFLLETKPFSVGMRIEHLTSDIDSALYGKFASDTRLGHAEYNLSYDTKNRGVYTFCMCPGGEVVAAASESGGVVVNGMSNSARSGRNSNSAVVCSIFPADYGNSVAGAIEFQRQIERSAYRAAGADYSAPIITVGDFLDGKCSTVPGRVQPTYMSGSAVKIVHPDKYLPTFVIDPIKNALRAFDKRISGFCAHDAVLTGAETRTSAPIRILRDNDTKVARGIDNLYPAGEGAGYAGGITSASVDGLRCAMSIIKKYKPKGD